MYEHVIIDKDEGRVVKHISPEAALLEFSHAKSAFALSQKNSLFIVPQPLYADIRNGIIAYQYIPGIKPLMSFRRSEKVFTNLVFRAAQALVEIHNSLTTSPRIPIEFSGRESGNIPQSFLHGDFNLENIQYDALHDKLVIIDWSLSPLLRGKSGNYGVVLWDVCWFLRSIFFSRPYVASDFRFRRRMAFEFITAYFNQRGKQGIADLPDFLDFVYEFSTPKMNPQIVKQIYYRQFFCRRNFKKFRAELETVVASWI